MRFVLIRIFLICSFLTLTHHYQLTHGLIMKERQRVGKEEMLTCNDSVKIKVKEYIRNYMKKFGAVYIRS